MIGTERRRPSPRDNRGLSPLHSDHYLAGKGRQMDDTEGRNYWVDEQLAHTIAYLVSGRERIKERLAYIAPARVGLLRPELLPEPLRDLASSIHDRLQTAEPLGDEGTVVASIRAMTEDEASELASDIFKLSNQYESYWQERER